MELQDTRFMNFVTGFWVRYDKFRGASRVCAIFLNFFLLVFKLVFCGVILLIYAPHLAANALRNQTDLSLFQKMLYVLTVIVSLAIDLPVIIVGALCVLITAQFVMNAQVLEAVIFGLISWGLIRLEKPLLMSLFCKSKPEPVDTADEYDEEEEVTSYDEDVDGDDIDFCQLFTIGTEMCLLIDHIEMCPDETAFIRVVDDEGYTPLYKRKVRRDKAGNRFIVFNSTNHYLDDKKTQPVITKK